MALYEYSSVTAKLCFSAGFLTNAFLIYLTLCHSKKITGIYRIMVVIFSVLGVFFSGTEIFSKPFTHNYNNAMIFFSMNNWIRQDLLQFSIALFAATYQSVVANIAVQFSYRYATLFKPAVAKKFDGDWVFLWILYPVIPGSIYLSCFYMFCQPDQFADDYVREEILRNYELVIEDVPRFVMVSLNGDGSLRWKNLLFLVQGLLVIAVNYLAIIYFGVQMSRKMKQKLQEFSATYQRLQKQFFRALIVQTMAQTFLFVLPAGPVLLGPILSAIFDIEWSLQTGWVCTIFTFYAPIDSIAFMIIVSEYRKIIKGQLRKIILVKTPTPTTGIPLQNRVIGKI